MPTRHSPVKRSLTRYESSEWEPKYDSHMKVGFVTFSAGEPRWLLASTRLDWQARRSKQFHKIHKSNQQKLNSICSPLEWKFISTNPKGFGFWLWKPIIILDFLEKNTEIDVVLYLDAGCELNITNESFMQWKTYLDVLKTNNALVFEDEQEEKYWTTREIIEYLGATEEATSQNQIWAGLLFMQRDFAIDFCNKWRSAMSAHSFRLLSDADASRNQITGFKNHRWDQSFLSLLMKSETNVQIRSTLEENFFAPVWGSGREWPIWAARNGSLISLRKQSFFWRILRFCERVMLFLLKKFRFELRPKTTQSN